jgi:hypothetical protein
MNILNELAVKQKMAIRIINNSPYNAHSESLFKKSKTLSLKYLAKFSKLQIMQHYRGNTFQSPFTNTWPTNAERRKGAEVIN